MTDAAIYRAERALLGRHASPLVALEQMKLAGVSGTASVKVFPASGRVDWFKFHGGFDAVGALGSIGIEKHEFCNMMKDLSGMMGNSSAFLTIHFDRRQVRSGRGNALTEVFGWELEIYVNK